MATALEDIFTQLQTIEAAITGVNKAYNQTPEAISVLPCFINFPGSSEAVAVAGVSKGIYIVISKLFVNRAQGLSGAESAARPFLNRFEDAILGNPTLNSTVNSVLAVRSTYGEMMYGGEVYLGFRFEIEFKLERALP